MKLWADFHPLVLTSAIGCPLPVVNQKLIESAREFCIRTNAWQEEDVITADGSTQQFDFATPTRAEMLQVVRASVAGRPLNVYGRNLLPPDWATNGARSDSLYHFTRYDYLLFPKPSAGELIEVVIAVRPGLDGAGVGDEVFESHAEHIAAGARYRLLRMPRTEWQDLVEAEIALGEFERGVHEAANRDFMQTPAASRRVKTWG